MVIKASSIGALVRPGKAVFRRSTTVWERCHWSVPKRLFHRAFVS